MYKEVRLERYLDAIYSFVSNNIKLFLTLGLVLSLAACAPQGQVNTLEMRVNSLELQSQLLNKKVQIMTRQLGVVRSDLKEVGKKDIASVRETLANMSNKMDEVQAELMRLNGLIDQVSYQRKQDYQEFKQFQNQIQAQIDDINQELKLLTASTKVATQVEKTREQIEQGKVDLYQQALDLFRQGKYQKAEQAWQTYIHQNPKGNLVSNAYFWIGECEYRQQRYEEAILDYQKVVSNFPNSNKIPDALLKQGMSFAQLGDTDSAKIVLDKLVKLYPNTPQARMAKKQLAMFK